MAKELEEFRMKEGINGQNKLGDRVQDTITGFAGIAVAITKYLDKYIQIGIQSENWKMNYQ